MRVLGLLALIALSSCLVAQGSDDADEKFNKEHKEMTDKLRAKHGLPPPPPGSGSVDAFGDMPRHPGGGRGHPDDYDDFGGDPAYLRDQMRERRHPRDIDDPRGMPRMPRMPRQPRMPRTPGQRRQHERRGYDDFERDDMYDDYEDDHRHHEELPDRNIGATHTVKFNEESLGLEISREWGHSHFLIDKVKGEAEKLGVKVGQAIVSVNGAKTRWKNLAQLTEQIKKAGRPVEVEIGEHRPHGHFGGRHHPDL